MIEPDGLLMLGAAESVVGITDAFRPYPDRRGLYRPTPRRARAAAMPRVEVVACALKRVRFCLIDGKLLAFSSAYRLLR